jgi:hypothetical protein
MVLIINDNILHTVLLQKTDDDIFPLELRYFLTKNISFISFSSKLSLTLNTKVNNLCLIIRNSQQQFHYSYVSQ